MDTLEVLPAVGPPASEEYLDEKASDTKEHAYGSDTKEVYVDIDSIGEVCEDIRPIDMDESGKEKPIGIF